MNRYDKDMMHDRELIYDAKKQEKHGGNKKHDEELIYDTKGDIYEEDKEKHEQDNHYATLDRASRGHHEHGDHASANKVHQHSRNNNPTSKRVHYDSSTDEGIATLYTGKREGMS
jgi:hypothetical protein